MATSEINPDVETRPDYDIEWKDMQLPINSELFDEWSISKKLTDHPELEVTLRICYISDDEWDDFLNEYFEMKDYPKNDIYTVEGQHDRIKWNWQKRMTRGISYMGRIYIKKSAHRDRGLLLHELGHTVPYLDHTEVWERSVMNPMSPMWGIDSENTR